MCFPWRLSLSNLLLNILPFVDGGGGGGGGGVGGGRKTFDFFFFCH